MAQYYSQPPPQTPYNPSNLQFYPSQYSGAPVSGHSTPAQAQYSYPSTYGAPASQSSAYGGFGGAAPVGVSGRMGEQGGLRTGWLAAFGTEGYEGEPPLLEELGVNFGHIKIKVGVSFHISPLRGGPPHMENLGDANPASPRKTQCKTI